MKKIFFVLLVACVSCNKNKDNDAPISNNCSQAISSYHDTLIVGNYKLFFVSTVSNTNHGAVEIIDKNNNTISGSNDFSIDLVQLQNADNCWETTSIQKVTGDVNTYDGTYSGIPDWAKDANTKAIVKLTVESNPYYLVDQ